MGWMVRRWPGLTPAIGAPVSGAVYELALEGSQVLLARGQQVRVHLEDVGCGLLEAGHAACEVGDVGLLDEDASGEGVLEADRALGDELVVELLQSSSLNSPAPARPWGRRYRSARAPCARPPGDGPRTGRCARRRGGRTSRRSDVDVVRQLLLVGHVDQARDVVLAQRTHLELALVAGTRPTQGSLSRPGLALALGGAEALALGATGVAGGVLRHPLPARSRTGRRRRLRPGSRPARPLRSGRGPASGSRSYAGRTGGLDAGAVAPAVSRARPLAEDRGRRQGSRGECYHRRVGQDGSRGADVHGRGLLACRAPGSPYGCDADTMPGVRIPRGPQMEIR